MAAKFVALIRGVNNIGMATRVAMADLRGVFEGLGFRNVRTLLNSGNVIFSAPSSQRADLLGQIENELASRLNLHSRVTLLSGQEVAAAVRTNPFAKVAINPSHCLLMVPRTRAELERLRPLIKKRWAPEALALGSRVAYLWCANGVARSPLWAAADRALDRTGTVRNIATFTKALTLIEEG